MRFINVLRYSSPYMLSHVHLLQNHELPCVVVCSGQEVFLLLFFNFSCEIGFPALFGMYTPSSARIKVVNDSKPTFAALHVNVGGKNFHFVATIGTLFNSERWRSQVDNSSAPFRQWSFISKRMLFCLASLSFCVSGNGIFVHAVFFHPRNRLT